MEDLAIGEPRLRLHGHCVLVVHLEDVGQGGSELHFLGAEENMGPPESLECLDHLGVLHRAEESTINWFQGVRQ